MESGLNASDYNAVAIIRERLGRPFEPQDLTSHPDRVTLGQIADKFVATYTGTFDFLLNLKRTRPQFGLSAGQTKGALNCLYNEYRRSQSIATREIVTGNPNQRVAPLEVVNAQNLTGYAYTVVHDDGSHHTYRIKDVEEGRYDNMPAGTRKILYLSGPDNTSSYSGMAWLYPNGTFKIWQAFLGDPDHSKLVQGLRFLLQSDADQRAEMGYQYALVSSRCCKCGRPLTVPASIHRGMGPVCAGGGLDPD